MAVAATTYFVIKIQSHDQCDMCDSTPLNLKEPSSFFSNRRFVILRRKALGALRLEAIAAPTAATAWYIYIYIYIDAGSS
jgi:hypothetical protein